MKFIKALLLSTTLIFANCLAYQTAESIGETREQKTIAQELPFYKENDHFIFYCEPVDQPAVDKMLEKFESFFEQISTEFKHNGTTKFTFKIYPNITAFHNAIGQPNAPDYICGYMSLDKPEAFSVSPNNPGSHHDYDSIITGLICKIVGLVLKDKYKNTKLEPSWLYLGICLYKSCYFNDGNDKFLAKDTQKLPTCEQLKQTYEKYTEFSKIQGWLASYSIAKFIDKKYGFDKLLALLENNNSTKSVLGVTEDEFRSQWIEYLIKKDGAKILFA